MGDNGIISGLVSSDENEESDNRVHVELQDLIGELRRQKDAVEKHNEEADEDEEEFEVPYKEAKIYPATDEKILDDALKRLQEDGAKEVRRDSVGTVETPSEHIDNPSILVNDVDTILRGLYDGLKERLRENQQKVNDGFRHLGDTDVGDNDETFAYLLAETDKGILIGGASNILLNIAEHLELNDIEKEYVRLVYDESIRQSEGLEDINAHLILDDVVFVFEDEKIDRQETENTE
jgi:hypothetical protein